MSFKSKDNVYVVRGESARAARVIGEQRDDNGEVLVSAYIRYLDDLAPLTEWVNPDDLVAKDVHEKALELAAKKAAKKDAEAAGEEESRQALLNDADTSEGAKGEAEVKEKKRQAKKEK